MDCGSWLVDICDALTDHASEFIEQLHDRIIDLEDNLLDQQVLRAASWPCCASS
nr:zinc transporter [Raoultella sp. NCTC 9187]